MSALTEPGHGSDSVALETTARRDGGAYVLDGKKKWIGNGTIADVPARRGGTGAERAAARHRLPGSPHRPARNGRAESRPDGLPRPPRGQRLASRGRARPGRRVPPARTRAAARPAAVRHPGGSGTAAGHRREWIAEHLASPGLPRGHGFSHQAARDGRAWYAFDVASLRCLMLDTVNQNGGWQGSLDAEQFAWLEEQLSDARRQGARGCVLFSHHPLDALVNRWSPDGAARAGADEVGRLIGEAGNVIAWINGHDHVNRILGRPAAGGGTWWETGRLFIACTSLDHRGLIDPRSGALDDPLTLAGWSRELSANQWQPVRNAEGTARDRNVLLARGGS